jgi:hypothetical protein
MGMWAWKKKLEKTILRDKPEEVVSSKVKRPIYKNNPSQTAVWLDGELIICMISITSLYFTT